MTYKHISIESAKEHFTNGERVLKRIYYASWHSVDYSPVHIMAEIELAELKGEYDFYLEV